MSESIETLREQVERTRLTRELREEQMASALLESAWPLYGNNTDDGRVIPPRSLVEPEDRPATWTVNAKDRQEGSHPVAYRNWDEFLEIIAMGRWLADANIYCAPILEAITDKVIGTGFTYRPVARKGQEANATPQRLLEVGAVLEEFDEVNVWPEWEREFFVRSRSEGEAPMRFFTGEDVLQVRSIEPEQIVQPSGELWGKEWAWGVHVDPDDQQRVLGYHVSYDGDPTHGEEVPADEILFLKVNVRRVVRRGLSDFFAVGEVAEELRKLLRNMRKGGSVLAAIAWIEQHAKATKGQVEGFASEKASHIGRDNSGRLRRQEHIEPGTVIRTGAGKEFLGPPLATANTVNLLEIARASRQALANRWNAPEIVTGDASNGSYSSLAVAESPFVAKGKAAQEVVYVPAYKKVKIRAIQHAMGVGRLPSDTLKIFDVHVEPPPMEVRDRLQNAHVNEIKVRNGVLSPQTWAQEDGLDFEEEQKEIDKAKAAGWIPPGQAPAPMDAGLGQFLGEGLRRNFPLWRRQTC